MSDFIDFCRALLSRWKVLVTGGSALVAVATVYALITGHGIPPGVGLTIVALTYAIASYQVWAVERTARALSVSVSGYKVPGLSLSGYPIAVFALLVNKSRQPRGVRWDSWTLDVLTPGGEAVTQLSGHLKGEIAPVGSEEQFSVEFLFPATLDSIPPDARLRLRGADIHGHPIETEFPANVGSSRPHTPRPGAPHIRVDVIHEVAQIIAHSPGRQPVLWGLRITNVGAPAEFEATVKILAGVTTGANSQRVYRLSFASANAPRVRIFSGADDKVFFGIAWQIPLYADGYVGKELWYYNEASHRNEMLPMVTLPDPLTRNPNLVVADLEVAIVSDPEMTERWTRIYRFGPRSELSPITA